MADPTILRGSDYFFTTRYEGNGGGQRVGNFVPFTDNGTIAKSCIFNRADSPNLSKTYGSAGTSQKKFTFSCWLKKTKTSTDWYNLFNVGDVSGSYFNFGFNSGGQNPLQVYDWTGSTYRLRRITNRTFEDTSKWYHIVLAVDTTESSGSDRVKIYVDGDQLTSFSTSVDPSQDLDTLVGSADNYNVGSMTSNYLDGYLAEVNYVDGTALTPSTFGLTDTSTGRWIPKTLTGITYGSNGFRMQFANSAGQTIGDDTSGNGNDFTVTNLAVSDINTDSPTQNHATIGENGFSSISEGNLKAEGSVTNQWRTGVSTLGMKSGKYYWEVKIIAHSYDNFFMFGICNESTISYVTAAANRYPGLDTSSGSYGWQPNASGNDDTRFENSVVRQETGTAIANDDILQFAYDADTDRLWVGKNNTFLYSGDPANGTNYTISGIGTSETRYAALAIHNDTSHKFSVNFGQTSFAYTPPSGFVALQQDNLPETSKGIPDFVWIKNRDATDAHQIYDSNRGPLKDLNISTVQESTTTDGLQKFLKGGFAIEDDVSVNTSGESYVSWNWVNNGGTTSTNEVGSIDSTTQVNSTAGFSIIQHTGNGTNGATIGHGLSQAPTFLITKNTSTNNRDWMVWHHKLANGSYFVDLNQAEQQIQSTSYTNSTAPSSTVITLGTSAIINGNGESYVTYAFHEVRGYSKFGTYEGNSSADGTFVYTGFKPSVILFKNIDSAGNNWTIVDNKRDPFNPSGRLLIPNGTNTEFDYTSSYPMDILSNGFKLRANTTIMNQNSIIYIAFAEHPFAGTSSINPATAR